MDRFIKFLTNFSLLIVVVGIFFVWTGFKPAPEQIEQKVEATTPADIQEQDIEEENVLFVVTQVVDGDTIKVMRDNTEYIIRLLGIDTPETKDPRKPVQCFGKEASSETKRLLQDKKVILEKDISDTDKYKRYLRHVYLPLPGQGLLLINDHLIRQGFARPLTIPPDVKYSEQFLEASRVARENKRGLWGKCL